MDNELCRKLNDLMDREAIRDTIYAYAQAIDRGDRTACLALFTPDAVLHIGVYEGPAADLFAKPRSGNPTATHHMLGNIRIKLEGDRARAITYISAIHHKVHPGRSTSHFFRARYLDVLVRGGDVWRIAERRSVTDWDCELPDRTAVPSSKSEASERTDSSAADDPADGFLD